MLLAMVFGLDCSRTSIYGNKLFQYCTQEFQYLANVAIDEQIVLPEIAKEVFTTQQAVFAGLVYVYNITARFNVTGRAESRLALTALVDFVDWRSASLSLKVEGRINSIPTSFALLGEHLTKVSVEFCKMVVETFNLQHYNGIAQAVAVSASLVDSQYIGNIVTMGTGSGILQQAKEVNIKYCRIDLKIQSLNEAAGLVMYQDGWATMVNTTALLDIGGRVASFLYGQLGSDVEFENVTLNGSVNALVGARYVLNVTTGEIQPNIFMRAVHLCVSGYNLSTTELITTSEDEATTFCYTCPEQFHTNVQSGQCCPEYTLQMVQEPKRLDKCSPPPSIDFPVNVKYKVHIKGYYQQYGELSILGEAAPTSNVNFSFDSSFAYMLAGNVSMYPNQRTFHNITFTSEININNGVKLALFRFTGDGTFYSNVRFMFQDVKVTKDASLSLFQHKAGNFLVSNVQVDIQVNPLSEGLIQFIYNASADFSQPNPTLCHINNFDARLENVSINGSYHTATQGALFIADASSLISLLFRRVAINLSTIVPKQPWSVFVHQIRQVRAVWFAVDHATVSVANLNTTTRFSVLSDYCYRSDIIAKNMSVTFDLKYDDTTEVSSGFMVNSAWLESKVLFYSTCFNVSLQAATVDNFGIMNRLETSIFSFYNSIWSTTINISTAHRIGMVAYLMQPLTKCIVQDMRLQMHVTATAGQVNALVTEAKNSVIETREFELVDSQLIASAQAGVIGSLNAGSVMFYNMILSNVLLQGQRLGIVGLGLNISYFVVDSFFEEFSLDGSSERQSSLGGTVFDSQFSVSKTAINVTFKGTDKIGAVLLGEVQNCSGLFESMVLAGSGLQNNQIACLFSKIIWSKPMLLSISRTNFTNLINSQCGFGAQTPDDVPIPFDTTTFLIFSTNLTPTCRTTANSFVKGVASDRGHDDPRFDDI